MVLGHIVEVLVPAAPANLKVRRDPSVPGVARRVSEATKLLIWRQTGLLVDHDTMENSTLSRQEDSSSQERLHNEQIINFVWGHKFNNKLHNQMQGYYMFEYGATVGGTPINGPAYSYAASGIGAPIPGKAYAVGFVDNLEYQVNKNDYISFRSGYLNDAQGWRTGVATHYSDFTLGYSHLFAKYWWIRPEVRWDHSYDAASFDNGTKRDLFSIAGDIIFRF